MEQIMPEPDHPKLNASQATGECRPDCPVCGAPMRELMRDGQCPRCLLGLANGFVLEADFPDGTSLADHGEARRFGDYELLEEVARGGMGVVYRARQLSLGREVAIKMILAAELATAESVQRFRNEAATAARLDHPNIVSVYEIGEHDMQHFFSMRLVLGRRNVATWAASLTGSSATRARTVADMMTKVARAVSFAHERGVLHRDLKPSNILVDDLGEPQVTDFGLAKLIHEKDSGLTLTAMMLGSPSYMAPEQADARHGDVTTATDVYGLGAVLYELLSGAPPFAGSTPLATARKVVEQMPTPLTSAPKDLSTICLKCLAKEPAQRYASAQALADDLERFSRGEAIHARPVTVPEALWRWARRSPKVAALIAAVLFATLAGVAGITWQWRRAERANAEQKRSLDHLQWLETARQATTDEAPLALARLADILRREPGRWQAAMLAMSMLDQRAFPMLAGPLVRPEVTLVTPPQLSPDGKWFAAGGGDCTLRVWDVVTGKESTPVPLESNATALSIAAISHSIALATEDGRVLIHTAGDPSLRTLKRQSESRCTELKFSADGSRLVARSASGLEVWNGNSLDLPPLMLRLNDGLEGLALSGDGLHVAAWNPKRAAVWDTKTGATVLEVLCQSRFRRGALAANGKRLALIDGPFVTHIWEVTTGALVSSIASKLSQMRFAALNADGTRITIAGAINQLVVHDVDSGLRISPPMDHLYQPQSLSVTPDGRRCVSFGTDGRACVWDAETGQAVMSAIWLKTSSAVQVDTSHDGSVVLLKKGAANADEDTVSVWRASQTALPRVQTVEAQRDFNSNRISPDSRLGCLGLHPGNRAYVYELATGRVVLDEVTEGHVYVHLFSPDMRRYYVLTANGWRYGWDLETGTRLWQPRNEPGMIRPGEISPDGAFILAGHNDGHVRIYDSLTGNLLRTLDHPGEVKVLRFAPDGSGRFMSASTDGVAHTWDVMTGEKLQTFKGHTHTIIAGAWSADSRWIATASYDHTARVWDANTGRETVPALPHLSWLSHLEFSPDSRLLATACRDGTVRLWDPATGSPASPSLPQRSTAETVRFTKDGACFVVRDHHGFRFWETQRAEPLTLHYAAPVSGGLGMDAEPWRAIMSPDGTKVHLGYSMNDGQLWSVPQPREAVPKWFPDMLEGLALMRLREEGTADVIAGETVLRLAPLLVEGKERGIYADWASRVLGVSSSP